MDYKKDLMVALYDLSKRDINNKSEYYTTIYELLEDYPFSSDYARDTLTKYAGSACVTVGFEDYIRNKVKAN